MTANPNKGKPNPRISHPHPHPPKTPSPKSRGPLAFDPSASHIPPPPTPAPTGTGTQIPPRHTRRWISQSAIVLGGVSVLLGFYVTFTYKRYKLDAAELAKNRPPVPLDNSARYQQIASDYDANVSFGEWFTGIDNLRKKLLGKARGHVLEMSVGTGRNASYYPLTKGIKSVTMVDQSSEMVRVARMNWAKTNAWYINAAFRIQSAAEAVPYPADSSEGFDTVVQTMGVCSTGDPVGILQNMGRLCKPEGKILLLEHGKGKYEWLNRFLDENAAVHAERWGCWFNKDVGEIVRDSGLEIVEERRYHFGTTWWFVLKPPKDRTVLQIVRDEKKAAGEAANEVVEETIRPWWSAWWK